MPSYLAWRRKHDRRTGTATTADVLSMVYEFVVFLEYPLLPYLGVKPDELLERGSALFILVGPLTTDLT